MSKNEAKSLSIANDDDNVLSWGGLESYTSSDVLEFSQNLLHANLIASTALAESGLQQLARGSIEPDVFHLAPSILEMAGQAALRPDCLLLALLRLAKNNADMWLTVVQHMAGQAAAMPPASKDMRFGGAAWNRPQFDLLRRAYASYVEWLQLTISELHASDLISKRRLEFFGEFGADALAPSNFLVSNPEALEEAIRTRGASLVRGMENLAADLRRGGGRLAISQTDPTGFELGRNLATTPGKVVFQNEMLQLLQFEASTPDVYEIPILLITPWINKYYIVDLSSHNSMVRWLTNRGYTVFVTSWVNPDRSMSSLSFDDYMFRGGVAAIEKVIEQTSSPRVNVAGYCLAGTMLSCILAYEAALGRVSRIHSASFFAAQQDFSQAGDLLLFTDAAGLRKAEEAMDQAGGVLPGEAMGAAFNMLRAKELIWSFFVSNYLMGKDPKPFDLLYWNSDHTRMPKAMHLWYLREFYQKNSLGRGELEVRGVRLDLKKVTTPAYVVASQADHIAPFPSVYRGAQLFGGPVSFVLAGSGHIAGVINPPAANRYEHWTGPALPPTPEEWWAGAEERPGSWWSHWDAWLSERSGSMAPARDPTAGPLAPIEDAPGSYLRVHA